MWRATIELTSLLVTSSFSWGRMAGADREMAWRTKSSVPSPAPPQLHSQCRSLQHRHWRKAGALQFLPKIRMCRKRSWKRIVARGTPSREACLAFVP